VNNKDAPPSEGRATQVHRKQKKGGIQKAPTENKH
jgi:hypothetical protein